MGLRETTLRGGAYLFVREGLGLGIRLGGVLWLTQIIGPTAYGLYAASLAITTVGGNLAWFGVDTYLRSEETVPRRVIDQAFWFLLATTLTVAVTGAVGTAAVGTWFLADDRYVPPLIVMFFAVPLQVLWTPAQALLERAMNYRRLAFVEVGADILNYAVSLPLALAGRGVWAPVTGYFVWQGTLLVGSFVLASYRPRWHWSAEVRRDLVRFGTTYTASQWIQWAGTLVNPLIIGRLLGPAAVGQVALTERMIKTLSFVRKITRRLALVILGRVQNDKGRLRLSLEEGMGLSAISLGPVLGLLGFVIPVLVPLFYGEDWGPVSRLYPYLGVAYLVSTLFIYQTLLLHVVRRTNAVSKVWAAHSAILAAVTFGLASHLGIVAYGIGHLVASVAFVIADRAARKTVPSFSYRRALPWVLAFSAPIFAPIVTWPWSLLLWAPTVLVAAMPKRRAEIAEYLRVGRRALPGGNLLRSRSGRP